MRSITRKQVMAFVVTMAILLPCTHATIIFQNNFDSSPDTHTGSSIPSGWDEWYASGGTQATVGGVTHWSGEISSPGRGGGKSLKMWRSGTFFEDYTGALAAGTTTHFNPTTNDIYIRWSMRLPSGISADFSNAGSTYQKLWRLNTQGGNGEIYLNINTYDGNSFPADAALQLSVGDAFYDPDLGYDTVWATLLPPTAMAPLFDGQWHSYELHIGTTTNTLECWVDGISKYRKTDFPIAQQNVLFIQHFGMGNRASGTVMQSSWQAWEFDDLVISDSYIGPVGSPVISSVSGAIQTGQTLTISGQNMLSQNTASWDQFYRDYPNAWSFEGASYSADGYEVPGAQTASCTCDYSSSVRLLGSKSLHLRQHGAWTFDPVNGGQGDCAIWNDPSVVDEFYVSAYVRWDASAGNNQWPDNYMKYMLELGSGVDEVYFQPQMNGGSAPTQMLMSDGQGRMYGNIPDGAIKNGRWYYTELHWKNTAPKRYEAWMDGTKIGDWTPTGNAVTNYMMIGIPNLDATTSGFDMTMHIDRFMISTARIYPAATVEIGNSPTYGSGSKRYQEPLYLSDGSIQVKLDLTGLGSGPYYLWITNNRQELSSAYPLSVTQPNCRDGTCSAGENCSSCPADCGNCTVACLPAETAPCDGCVSFAELSAYLARWKASSSDITLAELMEAIRIWKQDC
jgi:hypothetical protein